MLIPFETVYDTIVWIPEVKIHRIVTAKEGVRVFFEGGPIHGEDFKSCKHLIPSI